MVMVITNNTTPDPSRLLSLVKPNASYIVAHKPIGPDNRHRDLTVINNQFVAWRLRLGQLSQRVALCRAWDILPESLQRELKFPPNVRESKELEDAVNGGDEVVEAAIDALSDYVTRSWTKLLQCADAIYQDIRKRELVNEFELRILEVRCSPPVMWVSAVPVQRVSRLALASGDADEWSIIKEENRSWIGMGASPLLLGAH